ncbi:MAG: glycosyltransferase family 39 protein [Bacteroidota bacterium]
METLTNKIPFLKTGSNAGFLLFIVTLLGAILRFYGLAHESFWLDETASAIWAHKPVAEILQMQGEVHPPLYYLLLSFWVKVFGGSDFSLRAVSAIFSTVSIPLLYFTARELFKNKNTALISSLFLAVAQFHLQFSQEARSYTMMVFLVIASMYSVLRFLKTGSFKNAILYIFTSVLLLYSHNFGAFFLITQNIFFLIFKREYAASFKKWILVQSIIALIFLPWLGVMMRQAAAIEGNYWIEAPGIMSLAQLLLNFSGSLTVWGIITLVAFLSLIGLALWHKRTSFKSYPAFVFVLLWFVLPLIIALIVSIVKQPVFMPRFLIGTLPAFLLLAACGIELLQKNSFKNIAVAIITICSLINCTILLQETNKERWREAVIFTENLLKSDDTIIFHAGFIDGAYNHYTFKNSTEQVQFPREGNDITPENLIELQNTIRDKKRIFLVLSHSRDTNGYIVKVLKESFAEKQHRVYAHRSAGSHKELVGVEVYVFEK